MKIEMGRVSRNMVDGVESPEDLLQRLEILEQKSEGAMAEFLKNFVEATRYLKFAQDLNVPTLIEKAQALVNLFREKALSLIHQEVEMDSAVNKEDASKAA